MLAIIPARGGSKGLPGKNIRLLGGKPLIHWTIEAALKCKSIDRVILSTDSQEIADACSNIGIEIPFMRPANLAEDGSYAVDVYNYTINRLIQDNHFSDDKYVVLLPTVPFVTSNDIDNAVTIFEENNADSVISCTRLPFPKEWIFDVDTKTNLIKNSNNDISLLPRQNYKNSFIPNGGIYILRHSLISTQKTYYFQNTMAYEMPEERSIDIDTIHDFKLAEFIYQDSIK